MALVDTAKIELLPKVKDDLKIKSETRDPEIQKAIEQAIIETLGEVSNLASEAEIEADTLAEDLTLETARLYIAYRHKRKINSPNAGNFESDWLKSVERLKTKVKSIRTTRTHPVVVSKDPRDAKVPLPTMSSIYTFDDFV